MTASTVTTRRYPVAIGAVVAAVALWISVNMQSEYSVVKSVPVVFENVKEGKALRFPIPRVMSVRVKAKGWVAARLFLSPDVRYFINLATVSEDPILITAREAPGHVTLPPDVMVEDVKPETLMVALSDYYEKRVPVSARVVLAFREGYGQVGRMKVEPESVTVGGSLTWLAGIRSWNTEFRRYADIRAPIDEDLPVEEQPNYGVTVSVRSVRVSVNVEPFAEKVFSGIPVTVTSLPFGREVIFIPPRVDLVVRGGIEQLAAIPLTRFSAVVDYTELEADTAGSVVPTLKVPEGVRVVERKPQRFQFIIRKRL